MANAWGGKNQLRFRANKVGDGFSVGIPVGENWNL